MELLWGTIAPIGAGPSTKGTGSPAQVAVRAYGGRAGDCIYQTARANRLEGTGSPALAAVRAYGGPAVEGKPETAQAHQLGGQGVLPRRPSSPMEGLQGMTVHNGPGAPSGGTGSPAHVAVGAWLRGTLAPIGAGPPARRTGSPAQVAVAVYGGLHGTAVPKDPGPPAPGDGGPA